MKIEYFDPEIYRLDINREVIDEKCPLGPADFDIKLQIFKSLDADNQCQIEMKINMAIRTVESGEDVVVYDYLHSAVVDPDNPEDDFEDLMEFVQHGFVDFEFQFQQMSHNLFPGMLIGEMDAKALAEPMLNLIRNAGYYNRI
jgi:hypothetical protein